MEISITNNYASLNWITAILLMVGTLLFLIIQQIIAPQFFSKRDSPALIASLGLIASMYANFQTLQKITMEPNGMVTLFNQLLYLDAWLIKGHMLLIAATIYFLLMAQPMHEDKQNANQWLHACLVLTILIGSCLLSISYHWLMVYVSLISITIGTCLLIYQTANCPMAASIRYLIYSMVATVTMLLGLCYIYAATGTLVVNVLLHKKEQLRFIGIFFMLGKTLTITGLCMVMGSFPFHFWVANIYAQIDSRTTAYLSTVPKIAALFFLSKLLLAYDSQIPIPYLYAFKLLWLFVATVNMLIGHLAALMSLNTKKILAYGGIAQTGFLLMCIVADTKDYTQIMYYSIAYQLINMAAWIGLYYLTSCTKKSEYQGLAIDDKSANYSFVLTSIGFTIVILALIGLPPTIGFVAKFMVLNKLWDNIWQMDQSCWWWFFAFLTAILGTLLSLYYYLKLPFILFYKRSSTIANATFNKTIKMPDLLRMLLFLINVLLITFFFFTNHIKSFVF